MFLSEWREFPTAPCHAGRKRIEEEEKKKLAYSSRFDVVEIARVA